MATQYPIPTSQNKWTISPTLDGVQYVLYGEWNVRYSLWFMDIRDINNNNLVASAAMRVNYPIAAGELRRQMPGYLFLWDSSGKGEDAGFDDLGARHRLYYASLADLKALGLG